MSIKVCRGAGGLLGTFLVAGLLTCFPGTGRAAEPVPSASEVTRRMIERAEAVARTEQGPQYTYEKQSVLEHLDAAGRLIRSEEKLHEVILIRGLPFNRLVKIQGRGLTAEELSRAESRPGDARVAGPLSIRGPAAGGFEQPAYPGAHIQAQGHESAGAKSAG